MTEEEVKNIIREFPLGSKLQLIKRNGDIVEVKLASHQVEASEAKNYDGLEVPAQPAAIIVQGGTRFGKFRIETKEIVDIARIG